MSLLGTHQDSACPLDGSGCFPIVGDWVDMSCLLSCSCGSVGPAGNF